MKINSAVNLFRKEQNEAIHFVGIDSDGIRALEHIKKKRIKAEYTCINFPEKPIVKLEIINSKYEPFHYEKRSKEHSILDVETKTIFALNSNYVLLAQLGGYEETKMIKELFYYLQAENKKFMIICCMPFHFDSLHKKEFANSIKIELQKLSQNFKCIDFKPLREKYGHLQVVDFFKKVDEQFYSIFKEKEIG